MAKGQIVNLPYIGPRNQDVTFIKKPTASWSRGRRIIPNRDRMTKIEVARRRRRSRRFSHTIVKQAALDQETGQRLLYSPKVCYNMFNLLF